MLHRMLHSKSKMLKCLNGVSDFFLNGDREF